MEYWSKIRSLSLTFVRRYPRWIQVPDNRSSVNKIAPVEVMIIVIRVPKINARITRSVRSRRNDTAPGGLIDQRDLLRVARESGEGRFQLIQSAVCQVSISGEIVDGVDGGCEFAQALPL